MDNQLKNKLAQVKLRNRLDDAIVAAERIDGYDRVDLELLHSIRSRIADEISDD